MYGIKLNSRLESDLERIKELRGSQGYWDWLQKYDKFGIYFGSKAIGVYLVVEFN